jgi:hypothetical protein
MPPVRLTDSELDQVMAAARPLPVHARDAFLQHVASELKRCNGVGPGVVFRIVRDVQKIYFDAPNLEHGHAGP